MRMKLLLALLLIYAANAFAQTRSVSGSVWGYGEDEPLIGATVKVKGTKIATSTDMDGKFTLHGLKTSDKYLEVSYVGYESATVEITPDMKIYLKSTSSTLDEMIVVAFGKQKREAFTGAASVVDAAQIERQQVTNPIEALNGTVTGLSMLENNSFSGEPTITIRGIGSINASSDPLIVLDGMPFSGSLNDINPTDIANMTVLKDAASNALYGARGANGVILITSKNAQRGKTKVNFTGKWGVNTDGRVHYDIIDNPGEYYEAYYLATMNYFLYDRGLSQSMAHVNSNNMIGLPYTSGGLGYVVYNVPQGQTLIGTNGKLNPNATLGNRVVNGDNIYTLYPDNWFKEGLHNGLRQEYNLALSSGSEQYSFLASLGYLKDDGLTKGANIERYSSRLKADVQAYPFLKVGGTASYSHTVTNGGSSNNVYGSKTAIAPIYPLYIRDADGNIMTDKNGKMYDYGGATVTGLYRCAAKDSNYIQEAFLDMDKQTANAFSIQGFATADFLDGFHLTINGSTYLTETRFSYANNPYYGYQPGVGYVQTTHTRSVSFNTQQLLNYSKNFNGHSIDALIGHEYTRDGYTYLDASRNDVALYETNKELSGAITNMDMDGYTQDYNVEGYFVRGQYDYDSKYFASASFRRDGSSRFHPKHRWGNFWSLGAAYIISKEEWFPKNPIVNMLKIKLSYGSQGNDQIGNSYPRYTDIYKIENSDGEPAFVFANKGNENITWETAGNLNGGVEFEFFNSRLTGGIDVYWRKTMNMLMFFSTPSSLGYTGYYDNIGDMVNKGFELQLNGSIIRTKNFSWDLGLNLSWEKNKISYLPEEKKLITTEGYHGYNSSYFFYGEGLPMYTWKIAKYAGIDQTTGNALYYVTKKDGTVGTTDIYQDATLYLCGTALPDVFGGFNTQFKIFGFDINAQFNYSIGGKKYDSQYAGLLAPPAESGTGGGIHRDVFDSWSPDNTASPLPMWKYNSTKRIMMCDYFLTDASYFSIKNISVGYTFPKNILKAIKMANLRVFAQVDNIYYWTKRQGFDPRVLACYGAGAYAYAPKRTFTGGLSIEF